MTAAKSKAPGTLLEALLASFDLALPLTGRSGRPRRAAVDRS